MLRTRLEGFLTERKILTRWKKPRSFSESSARGRDLTSLSAPGAQQPDKAESSTTSIEFSVQLFTQMQTGPSPKNWLERGLSKC